MFSEFLANEYHKERLEKAERHHLNWIGSEAGRPNIFPAVLRQWLTSLSMFSQQMRKHRPTEAELCCTQDIPGVCDTV